ncbi:MAG: hypothetical protein KBS59_07910 [Clostridiales bacterium]|nr:hypothetical protein [Clostridiales bacterium]
MAEKKNVQIMTADAFDRESVRGVFGAYLFFGEEDYMKERKLADIRGKIMTAEGFELFNRFEISFSGASPLSRDEQFSALSDATDAMPMAQEQTLIEVHDLAVDKLSQSECDALVSACKKAGRETVLIIFCRENELSCDYRFEQGANFSKIASVATAVRFGLLSKGKLAGYAQKYLSKRKVLLSDDGADTLCDMCACRMMALTGELSKIAAYAGTLGDGIQNIDKDTVKLICAESPADEVPFALLDAMQKWSVLSMTDAISRERDNREEPIAVVAKMARAYIDMYRIKAAMVSGMSSAEISRALKMNAFRTEKYVASLGRVPMEIIENAISKTYELDLKLKSTQSDPWTLIDTFISDVYMPKSMR